MAAWLGRGVDRLVLPERPSAPRRGDFSSGMWKGAGSQEPGAGRRSTSSAGSQPVTGSWLWA